MLNVFKHSGRFSRFLCTLQVKNSLFVTATFRPYTYLVGCLEKRSTSGAGFLVSNDSSLILSRNKHDSKKSKHRKQVEEEESSDEEDKEDEEADDEYRDKSKALEFKLVNSRLDLIVKRSLKLPRTKVKEYLYADRIRINGMRVSKPAQLAVVGDQIDVIHEYKPESNSLIVSQIQFSKANLDLPTGALVIETKVFKNVNVKNYSNENAYKGKGSQEN